MIDTITTVKDSTIILSAIHFLRPDTVKPRLDGIGLFASNRLRLRFSEPVFPRQKETFYAFSSTDSIAFWVAYSEPENPTVYWALSESELTNGLNYSIPELPFQDQFRNPLESNPITVQAEAIKDSTRLRILEVSPKEKLSTRDTLTFLFTGVVTQQVLDSLLVIEQEERYLPYSFFQVDKNKLKIFPETAWDAAYSYQFRVFNPATMNYLTHSPEIVKTEDLGELDIQFPKTDSTGVWIIEVAGQHFYQRIQSNDSVLTVSGINDATVLVRVFRDENNNDKWDSGTLKPFKKPEWFYINPKVAIKPKMISELEIKF
jgi:hypothetical protein